MMWVQPIQGVRVGMAAGKDLGCSLLVGDSHGMLWKTPRAWHCHLPHPAALYLGAGPTLKPSQPRGALGMACPHRGHPLPRGPSEHGLPNIPEFFLLGNESHVPVPGVPVPMVL